MKQERQSAILELIQSGAIETQQQLQNALDDRGFHTTQATISRDLKELGIAREHAGNGSYHYVVRQKEAASFSEKLNNIFRECVLKVDSAQNIIVITTMPGLASAACSAIDGMHLPSLLGTLAGDDTGIFIMRDIEHAHTLCQELQNLIQVGR